MDIRERLETWIFGLSLVKIILKKLEIAFKKFGMPMFNLTLSKFQDTANFDVFTFGRPPVSIEILTLVKGLQFEEAYRESRFFEEEDLLVRCIQLHHLIEAKKAAGRNRDLNDIEQLLKKSDTE